MFPQRYICEWKYRFTVGHQRFLTSSGILTRGINSSKPLRWNPLAEKKRWIATSRGVSHKIVSSVETVFFKGYCPYAKQLLARGSEAPRARDRKTNIMKFLGARPLLSRLPFPLFSSSLRFVLLFAPRRSFRRVLSYFRGDCLRPHLRRFTSFIIPL